MLASRYNKLGIAVLPFISACLVLVCATVQTAFAAQPARGNHFTVTADPRAKATGFAAVCQAINDNVGGPGAFHVSPGDIDPIPPIRGVIDAKFGANALWYPGVGNHESETAVDMAWVRTEYETGNGVRSPLKLSTNQDGPATSVETTYSWDNPATNSHFIQLNEYWNGTSDTGTNGDIVSQLRTWLQADLIANQDKAIFVFGHEPAFPENRHVGDSLDQYPANRDAFWSLLELYDVVTYICGHTHYYSSHKGDKNGVGDVWQIDVGNAGNDGGEGKYTFLDVVLLDGQVRFDVYQTPLGAMNWAVADTWTVPANSVPEPATMSLLGLGALALIRRKKR